MACSKIAKLHRIMFVIWEERAEYKTDIEGEVG